MATAESVKNKLQGLIDTANETTGESAADLTTAIGTLIAGFGKGSGDEGGVKVWQGSKTAPSTATGTRVEIDFGFVPDFILVFANADVTGSTSRSYPIFTCGFSTAAAAALSVSSSQRYITTKTSTGSKASSTGWTIDGSDAGAGIRNTDATGFTLGSWLWPTTSLYVVAFKLT